MLDLSQDCGVEVGPHGKTRIATPGQPWKLNLGIATIGKLHRNN